MWFDYKNRYPAAAGFEFVGGTLCNQMALAQTRGRFWVLKEKGQGPAGLPVTILDHGQLPAHRCCLLGYRQEDRTQHKRHLASTGVLGPRLGFGSLIIGPYNVTRRRETNK